MKYYEVMNSKQQFCQELKKRVMKRQNIAAIGCWMFTVYSDWPDRDDSVFLDLLLRLSTMSLGPEFAFTYEELNQIADDLIAGNEVAL